jgi:hypothetical protein
MYVVVAISETPGGPVVRPAPGWQMRTPRIPVGVRHAVARLAEAPVHALCGADVTGWTIFPDKEFQPRHAASCQRCEQLVIEANRRA